MTTLSTVTIGTRGSQLALFQSEQVKQALKRAYPELTCQIKVIKTQGDKILDIALNKIGDKGLFTKEIEQALVDNQIDIAVHSLKDLPTTLPDGLCLGAVLEREDPSDVVVLREVNSLDLLPMEAEIGTGSLRRLVQLKLIRPDFRFKDLRGNIETRLSKMIRGDYDAIVMAKAALKRLNLLAQYKTTTLDNFAMVPAAGQGTIGLEIRQNDPDIAEILDKINHLNTFQLIKAERSFLHQVGGTCHVPVAAHARFKDQEQIELTAFLADEDGNDCVKEHELGLRENPVKLGEKLAKKVLAMGGEQILKQLNR